MFMNTRTEREKEREGRTAPHGGDFIRIPFWDISVERRGTIKHYKKRYQKKEFIKRGKSISINVFDTFRIY